MQCISKKDVNIRNLKPFVKWAGGKTQLLLSMQNAYPKKFGHTISKYAEPFVGGGAVLFDILNQYDLEEVYISDINAELINTYKVIKNSVDDLISALYKIQEDYIILDEDERAEFYYAKRKQFNFLSLDDNKSISIKKAALFIFLNKTCFNGLYRVNKQGYFNVPTGRYKNPTICDKQNLKNISQAIKNVKIVCANYQQSLDFIDKNTFVYCDPPYRPISDSSNFTAYTENQFNDLEQIKLAKFIDRINQIGAKVVISNSDPKNTNINDNFFDDLYKNYYICRVEANRMINRDGNSRGKITELLISNFKEEI